MWGLSNIWYIITAHDINALTKQHKRIYRLPIWNKHKIPYDIHLCTEQYFRSLSIWTFSVWLNCLDPGAGHTVKCFLIINPHHGYISLASTSIFEDCLIHQQLIFCPKSGSVAAFLFFFQELSKLVIDTCQQLICCIEAAYWSVFVWQMCFLALRKKRRVATD